jgi:hypothetical protein
MLKLFFYLIPGLFIFIHELITFTNIVNVSYDYQPVLVFSNTTLADHSGSVYTKWQGTWQSGDGKEKGLSSSIEIKNENVKQFSFSISATYISSFTDDDGKEVSNVHFGDLEGIAIIKSSNEAWYTSEEFDDYKLIFKMQDGKNLKIEERNTSTSEDYGITPMAGANVRFAGIYKKTK